MDRGERDNWRMEIKDIRLQNLRILIARAGSITDLAERVGTDRNYISQILSPTTKANVGTRLARSLEAAFHEPRGWMDQVHNELTDAQRMYVKLFGELPQELQEQAIEYLKFLAKQHGKAPPPNQADKPDSAKNPPRPKK